MENINTSLTSLLVPVSTLQLDPENARAHDARSIDAIANSLKEFGQQKPIVKLRSGLVVAGNGTLAAARQLGWQRIAAVTLTDESKAKLFAIADNRTAELSVWDNAALAKVLEDAFGTQQEGWTPDLVGFSEAEMMKILAAAQQEEVVDNKPVGEDSMADAPAQPDAPPSHVRMVQLFLDEQTHERFMTAVKVLSVRYKTTTITDTVLAGVEELAAAVKDETIEDAVESSAS